MAAISCGVHHTSEMKSKAPACTERRELREYKIMNAKADKGSSPDNALDVALAYLAKHQDIEGLTSTRYLFPLIRDKGRPAIKDNLNLASNQPDQIRAWYNQFGPNLMW